MYSESIRGVEKDSPQNRVVTAAITEAARRRKWPAVEQALARASPPNTIVYNAAMSAAIKCGQPRRATELYETLCCEGLVRTLVTYVLAIRAFARAGNYQKSVSIGHEMMSDASVWQHVRPEEWEKQVESAYTALVDAAGQAGNVAHAMDCLQQFRKACDKPPSLVMFGAALNACKNAKDAPAAGTLLADMRGSGHKPNIISYTTAMAAHRRRPLEEVKELVDEMRADAVAPEKAFVEEHVATLMSTDLPAVNLPATLAGLSQERLDCLNAALGDAIERGVELSPLVMRVRRAQQPI